RYAAVLHAGYGKHEVVIVDLNRLRVVSRTPVHETFYGLEFSSDGNQLFCSGAGDEVVHAFRFHRGTLVSREEIRLRDSRETGVPSGLAIDRKMKRLFVANLLGNRITRIESKTKNPPVDILLGTNTDSVPAAPAGSSADEDVHAADKRAA